MLNLKTEINTGVKRNLKEVQKLLLAKPFLCELIILAVTQHLFNSSVPGIRQSSLRRCKGATHDSQRFLRALFQKRAPRPDLKLL